MGCRQVFRCYLDEKVHKAVIEYRLGQLDGDHRLIGKFHTDGPESSWSSWSSFALMAFFFVFLVVAATVCVVACIYTRKETVESLEELRMRAGRMRESYDLEA